MDDEELVKSINEDIDHILSLLKNMDTSLKNKHITKDDYLKLLDIYDESASYLIDFCMNRKTAALERDTSGFNKCLARLSDPVNIDNFKNILKGKIYFRRDIILHHDTIVEGEDNHLSMLKKKYDKYIVTYFNNLKDI